MKAGTTTIHLRGADARNFMKAVAAERASADEGREDKKHVPILIAMEAAQRELLARVEKAESDRAALVEALEWCVGILEPYFGCTPCLSDECIDLFNNTRAALARVKGEA